MTPHRTHHRNAGLHLSAILLTALAVTLPFGAPLRAADLPPELPLWEKPPAEGAVRTDVKEQVRSAKPPAGSLSGLNRAFSSVSSPTYSIHRPKNPNGVGLVICPGGGFRDVWLDREGHDLALWLKDRNVTCLVLKYRTRPADLKPANAWQDYQRAVRSDGWQAVRLLRKQAKDLGLQPDKIGICGFSAGGHLAASCALYPEADLPKGKVGGTLAGQFRGMAQGFQYDPGLESTGVFGVIAGVVPANLPVRACLAGSAAVDGLGRYFGFCNLERPHQSLAYRTPQAVCPGAASAKRAVSGRGPPVVDTAGHAH